jgi:dynein heavy chain, axonemal
MPDATEHPKYLEYIDSMPAQDSPLIFGLNHLADLTFRLNESLTLINTLVDTQPKESGGAGGLSREDEVKMKIQNEFEKQLPANFIEIEYMERLRQLKAPPRVDPTKSIPLSVFLRQEIQQLQKILDIVRTMLSDMVKAIDGEIIMTPELVTAINNMYDIRVPHAWMYDATGVEISWISPSLGSWLNGLQNRHRQLNSWITKDRPPSYWLTGFMRPQGFLTAVKQEVCRQHSAEKWSLDEVDYKTDVQKDTVSNEDGSIEGRNFKTMQEGVLVHGLFLEGAQWQKQIGHLEESQGKDLKDLYFPFPIIHVYAQSTAKNENDNRNPTQKGKDNQQQIEKNYYFCPVYKYKQRSDKYLIFRVYLKPEGNQPLQLSANVKPAVNWKLKGAALLCSKE